jgi:pimeloyl-ACP methyl ester carboxylesterase
MSNHFRVLHPIAVVIATIVLTAMGLGISFADEPRSTYSRKSPAGADSVIVFVHGLREDGKTGWTNTTTNAYWPELLKHDRSFDASDIFVYSYPTGLVATLSIDELADNMRATLNANGVPKYSKIIFLSHSMGGIVTRAYLLKYRDIAERTVFAYFFSTPTTGSQVASVARWAFKNPQIDDLRLMGAEDYLANLARAWGAANFSFPSYCAYEKKPTDGLMLVVSMESATALCNTVLDPIDMDHSDIVKPEDQNSPSYVAFKSAYITVESELTQKAAQVRATEPIGDSLVRNTGTISINKFDHNLVINGRPEQLTITTNHGEIKNNTITDNFVDGNVSLLDNSGAIDNNEIERNTIMEHADSNSAKQGASPFNIVDGGQPIHNQDGTFTCSFRIQMGAQAKVDYLTVALEANDMLAFRVTSDQPATRLDQFVGYVITKVMKPTGVITVLRRYSKPECNHNRRISWGYPKQN